MAKTKDAELPVLLRVLGASWGISAGLWALLYVFLRTAPAPDITLEEPVLPSGA